MFLESMSQFHIAELTRIAEWRWRWIFLYDRCLDNKSFLYKLVSILSLMSLFRWPETCYNGRTVTRVNVNNVSFKFIRQTLKRFFGWQAYSLLIQLVCLRVKFYSDIPRSGKTYDSTRGENRKIPDVRILYGILIILYTVLDLYMGICGISFGIWSLWFFPRFYL